MNDMEIACFLSVARTGSFTISARELSSTQQSVSRNIQALEEDLGFPLLLRGSSQAVKLTWAGQRFRQWRIEHDAQLSALERQCRRMTPEGANEIYLAWNDWINFPDGIEEDICAFREMYPHAHLHVRQGSTEEVFAMLHDAVADIAILPEYCTHDLTGLVVTQPFACQKLCFVSRDWTELPEPEQLASMTQLAAPMGEGSEEATLRRVQMFCAELGIPARRIEIQPNIRSVFTQLLCGGSYTVAPVSDNTAGLHAIPLPGASAQLVFVTPQTRLSPWGALLESFIRQRRHST